MIITSITIMMIITISIMVRIIITVTAMKQLFIHYFICHSQLEVVVRLTLIHTYFSAA